MRFYVVGHSYAAPVSSDISFFEIEAESAEAASITARRNYYHPAGLFSLAVYSDQLAYANRHQPLVLWLFGRQPPPPVLSFNQNI